MISGQGLKDAQTAGVETPDQRRSRELAVVAAEKARSPEEKAYLLAQTRLVDSEAYLKGRQSEWGDVNSMIAQAESPAKVRALLASAAKDYASGRFSDAQIADMKQTASARIADLNSSAALKTSQKGLLDQQTITEEFKRPIFEATSYAEIDYTLAQASRARKLNQLTDVEMTQINDLADVKKAKTKAEIADIMSIITSRSVADKKTELDMNEIRKASNAKLKELETKSMLNEAIATLTGEQALTEPYKRYKTMSESELIEAQTRGYVTDREKFDHKKRVENAGLEKEQAKIDLGQDTLYQRYNEYRVDANYKEAMIEISRAGAIAEGAKNASAAEDRLRKFYLDKSKEAALAMDITMQNDGSKEMAGYAQRYNELVSDDATDYIVWDKDILFGNWVVKKLPPNRTMKDVRKQAKKANVSINEILQALFNNEK